MNCAECTEQLVPHLEGLLDQSQQRQLESHLDDCPTCRAELDRIEIVVLHCVSGAYHLHLFESRNGLQKAPLHLLRK